MILYDYFRSSAAYRVRIALELKGLKVEHRPVHLLRGEQVRPEYLAKNPLGLVPALELDDGTMLTQSLAIIDYLDALYPTPPLLPEAPASAAKARAVALAIACDIHPLTNLRVGAHLEATLKLSRSSFDAWRRHWIEKGLEAIEQMIAPAPFCFGASPSVADLCLVAQLYSARRFESPLERFPRILIVEAACAGLPAFQAAHPLKQADAE
jgi:maleylacetoacetate isomerase